MPSRGEVLRWTGAGDVVLEVDPATLAGALRGADGVEWAFAGCAGIVEEVITGTTGCVARVRSDDGEVLRLSVDVLDDGARFTLDADPSWRPPQPGPAWPPALLPRDVVTTELALPIRTTQGILHRPDPADPVDLVLDVNGGNSAALSMPFWFVCTATSGLLSVLDTPSDAVLSIRTGASGASGASGPISTASVAVRWSAQLGRFGGARSVRHLITPPGYVAGALRYRRHVEDAGRLVTLADKISRRPQVAGLVGAPYFSTGYLPFSERKLRQVLTGLTDLGFGAGLIGPVDLLQWGAGPWLNDYQPFISEPGFADVIDAAGFTPFAWFYLEDQLEHDPTFDPASLAVGPDGRPSTGWQNRDYVYRRVCDATIADRGATLRERAGRFTGLHFDTTTAKELGECWSPDHPMTRDQSRQARHDWLAEVASWGHVVGSESGCDWAFDVIDFCSNNPRRGMETAFPGRAAHVPLQGLVYHDCVVSYGWEYDPYNPSYFGGDWAAAKIGYDLMCGNPPTVSPVLGYFPVISGGTHAVSSSWVTWEDPVTQRLLRQAKPVADLHARVAHTPMVEHAWLDEACTVSRTAYADGTEVVVNAGPEPFAQAGSPPVAPWSWVVDGHHQSIGFDGVDGRAG